MPQFREVAGGCREFRIQLSAAGIELLAPFAGAGVIFQALRRFGAGVEYLGQRRSVAPFQREEFAEACFDGGERLRVEIDLVGKCADRFGKGIHFVPDGIPGWHRIR